MVLFVDPESRDTVFLLELGDLEVHLLPVFLPPTIDFVLLAIGKTFVEFPRNLDLKGERDARFRGGRIFAFRRILIIIEHFGPLLLCPAREDNRLEDGIPGISTVRLDRRELPLLVGVEFEIPASRLGRICATTIVEPGFDLLGGHVSITRTKFENDR